MAAGITIKHKRKAGAFVGGELAAGELGLDITNSNWYFSVNGSTVTQITSGAVASVFGRTGAVVAAANDYAASQVNNDSGVAGTGVAAALNTLNTGKAATSHTHNATDINAGDIATARMQVNVAAALQASGAATISNSVLILDGGLI